MKLYTRLPVLFMLMWTSLLSLDNVDAKSNMGGLLLYALMKKRKKMLIPVPVPVPVAFVQEQ